MTHTVEGLLYGLVVVNESDSLLHRGYNSDFR